MRSPVVFGVWITAALTPHGSVKYKLERSGQVIRGRFDAHGRVISEDVVESINPGNHAQFYKIVQAFQEIRAASPGRTRTPRQESRRARSHRSVRLSAGTSEARRDARTRARILARMNRTMASSYDPPPVRLYGFIGGRGCRLGAL